MGYTTVLYRMYRPLQKDINHVYVDRGLEKSVHCLDSETKKALIDMGLKNLIIKRAGKSYIGIEKVDPNSEYPGRFNDEFYDDYWNTEIRNRSVRFGWDIILTKERAEEFCKKYVGPYPWNKVNYKRCIIDHFIDGETIIIRE